MPEVAPGVFDKAKEVVVDPPPTEAVTVYPPAIVFARGRRLTWPAAFVATVEPDGNEAVADPEGR